MTRTLVPGTGLSATIDAEAETVTMSLSVAALTTEQIQDLVAAMIVAGSNITATYDDTAGTLTLASTGGGGDGLTTEQVQDAVAAMIVEGDNVTATYDDGAGTLTLAATGGGGGAGGGSAWTQVVNEIGTSLTNWTNVSGTWASDGSVISQSDTAGAYRALSYNTKVTCTDAIIDFEIYYPASGFAGVGFGRSGVNWGPTASVGPQFLCVAGTSVRWRSEENSSTVSLPVATTANTWTHFQLHIAGTSCAVWKDGTYCGTVAAMPGPFALDSLLLVSYGTGASWRNIKMWTPSVSGLISGSGGGSSGTTYGSDIAPTATLTASNTESGHAASLLIDGNASTYWSNGSTTAYPCWLRMTFETAKALRKVEIANDVGTGYGLPSQWVVQYSDDAVEWYGAGPAWWSPQIWRPPLVQTLTNPDVGSHVHWRVVIVLDVDASASSGDYVRVSRLSAFEAV